MKKLIALVLCISLLIVCIPSYAAKKITVYTPDGRTATIWDYDLKAWKEVGWYEYPVTTMYAPDGRTAIIAKAAVKSWQKVGWYTVPVTTVYAPDGRTAVIAKTDVAAWVSVGWYHPSYTSPSSNNKSSVKYYSGTNIPTYTSITGDYLTDTIYIDEGICYVYNFYDNDTVVDYIETLCDNYGWYIYNSAADYEDNAYIIVLAKSSSLLGIVIDYENEEVGIIILY